MKRLFVLLSLLATVTGCPVTQPQYTPVAAIRLKEKSTGRGYWLYVPSNYDSHRDWPMVVTLHGTHGWDDSSDQIREWKHLAEQHGLIVAAPDLESPQGILPVIRSLWYKDLAADERTILAVIDEVSAKYHIDPNSILLTGFSAGGYPMYYTGLSNPKRFNMIIARACNSDIEMFDKIKFTDDTRALPIYIFNGKDDLKPIQDQSWAAFQYLREHKCFKTERREIKGGHLRRPELTYTIWLNKLPARHRM